MGGLAHYLERAGIATTQISLVRPHTEKICPPRALWVPFELGRPCGPPRDVAFQTRVIRAALALLERPSGPVLEDYSEEMPASANATDDAWVCPVSFNQAHAAASGDAALAAAFATEFSRLLPWYERAVEIHGRTTVGPSGLDVSVLPEFLQTLLLDTSAVSPHDGMTLADTVRLAAEDLKAFYFEAASVQPGNPDSRQMTRWFWHDTRAGEILRALKVRFEDDRDEGLRLLGQLLLVPRAALE